MGTQKKRPWKEQKLGRSGRLALKALMVLAVLGTVGGFFLFQSEVADDVEVASKGTLIRRETRPILSPSLFVGNAARAHAVAQAIPDVLDQLYCYCECDKNLGHKSLLSCYTDGHAAT